MQFVHAPLTWGFFLVLVPLLIHLINMMRHGSERHGSERHGVRS